MSVSSSISGSSSLFDFTRVKPLNDRQGQGQDDEDKQVESPSADLLRMIQGITKPAVKNQQPEASNNIEGLFAQIQLNGQTIATIYNDDSAETSSAPAQKSGGESKESEFAQKHADLLAAAADGAPVTANSALSQAQSTAQQADKPGAIQDPIQQEKQRWYSGTRERGMIADPSMLVQAQLFAQQGFDPKSAMQYVPPIDDRMSAGGASV